MTFILLYLVISHVNFAFNIRSGNTITDRQFCDTLIYSYLWFLPHNKRAQILQSTYSFTEKVLEWNEKFRSLLYFVLFGTQHEVGE